MLGKITSPSIKKDGKLLRRFYEPIALLRALVDKCPGQEDTGWPTNLPKSELQTFQCFVCKLAQVCDNEPGGDTVTAFSVLKEPQGVVYIFGTNRRKEAGLMAVTAFVTSLFTSLREADGASDIEAKSIMGRMFRDILAFNKPRMEKYVFRIRSNASLCLETSGYQVPLDFENDDEENRPTPGSSTDKEDLAREILTDLYRLCHRIDFQDETYLDTCEKLLAFINRVNSRPFVWASIGQQSRVTHQECWYELRHYVGRLVSMSGAAKFLERAARKWPALVAPGFRIIGVASSSPAERPLKNGARTVEEIIGRMTSDPLAQKAYQEKAAELETRLKPRIHEELKKARSTQPIVHAEVLVADWLRRNGGLEESRFFNGCVFVGCSKPTCRLCSYYFKAYCDGAVQVRSSHGNIYLAWRVPDVNEADGCAAMRKRTLLINAILKLVRQDVIGVLIDHTLARGRKYDSFTNSSQARGAEPSELTMPRAEDLLSAQMERLSTNDNQENTESVAQTQGDAGGDDDDEEGGASLT